MSLLFANTRGGAQAGALLEFKAGRSVIEQGSAPNTRKVVPQQSKGMIYLKLSNDQLLHFCWKERESNEVRLDLIVFPGDTEWIKMKEASDGRVYMLKFKSSNDRHIFWMQDAKADKDEDIFRRVNELLNNPTPSRHSGYRVSGVGGASAGAGASSTPANQLSALQGLGLANAEEMGALGNMDQNQLMQLLNLMNGGGSAGGGLMFGANPSGGAVTTSQKSSATVGGVSSMPSSGGAGGGVQSKGVIDAQTLSKILNAVPSTSAVAAAHPPVDLPSVLSRANVQESVNGNAAALLPHVPSQEPLSDAGKELNSTVGNPQFRQAAEFFGTALQTGKLADALPHFGIKEGAVQAAQRGDFLEFAKELTKQEGGTIQPSTSEGEKKSLDEEGTIHETNESAAKKAEGAGDGKKDGNSKKDSDNTGGGGDAMDLD